MTNAKDLAQTFINQGASSILCPTLGLLLNGAWILYDISLRQQGIRDGCWSVRITSPSGLKLNHRQILGTWMPRDLFRKILSPGLGSLIPSSQIMVFNLIEKPSRGTVVTCALRIGISPRLIHKGMDRLRLLIR